MSISPDNAAGCELHFELQPILAAASGKLFGHELLYRGALPADWALVDRCVLQFLATTSAASLLFVNLANETVLSTPDAAFLAAARANRIVFEISEAPGEPAQFPQVARKINALARSGVAFAIDDFGSGRDGLDRLYSIDTIHSVKIDGGLLRKCMSRDDAASMLRSLLREWARNDIRTIAECIEDRVTFDFARSLGIDLLQGWYVDALVDAAGS